MGLSTPSDSSGRSSALSAGSRADCLPLQEATEETEIQWLLSVTSVFSCSIGFSVSSVVDCFRVLEALDDLRAHDELLLREHALEPDTKIFPPRAVELLDHDFVNDDVVARRLPAILAPQALGRRSRVRGQAAEARRELVANTRVERGWKRLSAVVV